MTDRAQTILTVAMAAYTSGWLTGLWVARRPPRDRDPDWRRSFNHENTNRPSGPPPLRFMRSGDSRAGPTTPKPNIIPKPQFPPPRIVREDFLP